MSHPQTAEHHKLTTAKTRLQCVHLQQKVPTAAMKIIHLSQSHNCYLHPNFVSTHKNIYYEVLTKFV